MYQKKLLIADDSELNRAILVNVLEPNFDILEVTNGKEAIAALRAHEGEIAALLLDVVMPEADGFEVLTEMNRSHWIDDVPTIMISAETSGTYIDRAFQLGASDYVSRPFVPSVIRRRIMNTILLHSKKQRLMSLVTDRFYRRERNTDMLVAILDYAVEFRCGEGGSHMSNVSRITELLLHRLLEKTDRYAVEPADVETICVASSLHDIGKLLIPKEILTKPSALTPSEYEIIQRHTQLGAKMITELPIYQDEKLVHYAIEICHWHHERWNGEGYPDGLRGDEIPISAQVVSIADAYDALTSKRCYKEAFSPEKSLAMIHRGECGSFNPLLLACLDDIADTLRQECTDAEAANLHTKRSTRAMIEDLYTEQGMSGSRMTLRFEEEHAKRRFFSDLTDEIWFEFTHHPDTLVLSNGATRHTGLPRTIVDPFSSAELRAVVGDNIIRTIRERLARATFDETYLELETTFKLNGRPRQCRIAMQIAWSVSEPGQYIYLLGQVEDIDARYHKLEHYAVPPAASPTYPALMPVAIGEDHVLRLTGAQVAGVLACYRQLFETVRLVDPEICMQLTERSGKPIIERNAHCFAVWNRTQRCENCISQEAVRHRCVQTKIEAAGDKVSYVLAVCVEVDGTPYALELVNPIRIDDMRGGEDASILNQLLLRNRQVYTDSVTRVYNRRYFDERLRGLDGEYAMAMIDMDNFKHINDTFGHLAGDAALYHTAQAIRSEIRSGDEVVRYGGDEFFLLFHDMPSSILKKKLQSIRRAIERIEIPEYPTLHITSSIGGAHAVGLITETIHKADLALYQSKARKNCVTVYEEDNPYDHF